MPIDRVFPAGIPEADVCIAAGDIVEGDTVGAVRWLADTIGMSRSNQIGRPFVLFATSAFGAKQSPQLRKLKPKRENITRPSLENTNRRVRKWLSREVDPLTVTDADLIEICSRLNATPRKCLGYRTPAEAFRKKVLAQMRHAS